MQFALRRASTVDAKPLHKIRSQPSARVHQPLEQSSLDELRDELARRAEAILDSQLATKVHWVVLVNAVIGGWISLDVTSRTHGIASIGYSVGEEFRGMGVATSAVQQLATLAFNPANIAIERLEAVAAVDNVASQRVLTKTGFRVEGIPRGLLVIDDQRVDHVRFGILRNDVT